MSGKEAGSRKVVEINRAPVLTLWATVVAERLGYDNNAALTLGKAVAGLNAQAKGRSLGIYEPSKEPKEPSKRPKEGEEVWVEVCGWRVPAVQTKSGIRAVAGDQPVSPASVDGYLHRAFGSNLGAVEDAMKDLAKQFTPEELEKVAYGLYEQFRPSIPKGKKGWGAKGELDLNLIRSVGERGN